MLHGTSLLIQFCTSSITSSFLLNWCLGLYLCSPSNPQTFSSRILCTDKYTDVDMDTHEPAETHAAFWVSFHSGTNVCMILTTTSGKEKGINPVTMSPSISLPSQQIGPKVPRCICCPCTSPLYSLHLTAMLMMNSAVLGYFSKRWMDFTSGYQNLNIEFFLCSRVS